MSASLILEFLWDASGQGLESLFLSPEAWKTPWVHQGKSSSRLLQDSPQSVGFAGTSNLPPFIIGGPMERYFLMVDPSHIYLGGPEDSITNYPCNSWIWIFVNWNCCCCFRDWIFRENHLTGGRWLAFNEALKEMGRGVVNRGINKNKE